MSRSKKSKILRNKHFLNDIENMSVENSLDEFQNDIEKLKNKNSIDVPANNKYIPKHWWDGEANRLFAIRNLERRKFRKSGSMTDYINYDKADKQLKSHIRKKFPA